MKKLVSAIISLVMIFSMFGAFPQLANAASYSDADFFAKLNLNLPALSSVKAAVEQNDYKTAKAELLSYFKERHNESSIKGFGVTAADENYGMAVLPMRNILTGPYEFDMWQAEFSVTSGEYQEYTIDVKDRVAHELDNKAVSFMLFAGDKQSVPVYVASKESGDDLSPKLEITYERDGAQKTVTVSADNDTYVSSKDAGSAFGGAQDLVIIEDPEGSNAAVGNDTRRAYINFPIGEAANSDIISANLILNAKCDKAASDVLIINVGDTVWKENELKWSGINGSIYSYQNLPNPTWGVEKIPNVDGEYHNVTSRFWFGKPMAYEYLSYLDDSDAYNDSHPYCETYPGEDFGPKLVDLMVAFASQMNYGYTRTLETGERLNRWVDIVDAFLGTEVFDGREDDFVKILSFMWGDCNYLAGLDISSNSVWWSNWKLVANAGFFKAVEFLPEFKTHDTWRAKVEGNVEYTFDTLYNSDYSFTEAGPSYGAWCAKLFGDCVRAADMSGNPLSLVLTEKIRYAARNALESYYPNGYDTNIGDSNYRDQMAYFELLDEAYDYKDSIIHAYVTGDGENAEYLSRFYNNSNSAYLRNSWDPDEAVYVNFTNNPSDGHAHPDPNQVLMYAYGQPLLVDSGRYGYSATNNIYDQLRWARAHNTVEAVGVSINSSAYHSSAATANSLENTASNDTFDFVSSEQHGYPGVSHTRNVFFARSGYSIVTDYLSGTPTNTYSQNWHFLPSSNAAVQDGTTVVKTNFYNKPNITIASSGGEASVQAGYHSADYGLVAQSEYAAFQKTGSTVKFETLLYPTRANEDVSASVNDLAPSDNSKAALEIDIDGEKSYYYVKNTAESDGTFGDYTTDAKMAYVTKDSFMLANGTKIDGRIESSSPITSIAVSTSNGVLEINGEDLTPSKDSASAVKIYAPGTKSVTLNGKTIDFTQSGDFVYAVSSSADVVITEKVYPTKDGFVAYTNKAGDLNVNEGADSDKRGIIQAASSSWNNRNAYMAFDLSEFEGKNITSAVLKMKMTANEGAGDVHFYYLDYGDWTRDNLKFVLDGTKMPTHGTNASNTFTGYKYHWSGSAAGVPNGSWASFTSNFKEYLEEGSGSYKFTWAILSAAGSGKYSSVEADEADRPYLEISYLENEANPDPTVKTNIYLDGTLHETTEKTAKRGTVVVYDKTTIEVDGVTYFLDTKNPNSSLSALVNENGATINAYFVKAVELSVSFKCFENEIKTSEKVSISPFLNSFIYDADPAIIADGVLYALVADSSDLTYVPEGETALTAVYEKVCTVTGENLVPDGSFEDENGDFSWGTWLSPNGKNGYFKDKCEEWFYKVNRETNEAVLYPNAMTASDFALGTRWNDGGEAAPGQTALCSLANYIPVEKGKTYLIAYDYKHKNIGEDGGYIVTSFTKNEKSFTDGEVIFTPAPTRASWSTAYAVYTAPDDGFVYFHFRWLGANPNAGDGPYWYFDNFTVAEASPNLGVSVKPASSTDTTVTLTVTNDSLEPVSVKAFAASLSDGDVISGVDLGSVSLKPGESAPVTLDAAKGTKIFFWNDKLQPIAEPLIIE